MWESFGLYSKHTKGETGFRTVSGLLGFSVEERLLKNYSVIQFKVFCNFVKNQCQDNLTWWKKLLTHVPYVWFHACIRSWTLEFKVTVSYCQFARTIWEPGNVCGSSLDFIWISGYTFWNTHYHNDYMIVKCTYWRELKKNFLLL